VTTPPVGAASPEAGAGGGATGLGTGAGAAGVPGTGLAGQAGFTEPVNRSPTLEELDRKNERIKSNTMRSICRGC
jgi:hypothetical protein